MPPAGELCPSTPETPQRQKSTASAGAWGDDFVSNCSNGEARGLVDVSPRHEKSVRARVEKGSPRTPNRGVADGLRAWSESPISPRQRSTPNRGKEDERENWDDDFLDSSDSPAKPSISTPAGSHGRRIHRFRTSGEAEEENWDEEFELGFGPSSPGAGPSTRSKRLRRERDRDRDVVWDLSDDENEFDREMGLDRNDEEDKTVTSRSRRKPLGSIGNDVAPLPSLPSLPPLPIFLPTIPSGDATDSYTSPPSPFPRSSPSHSVFSIPGTTTSGHRDRDSTYGSTAHLALSLRRTHSADSSPSSPRRRKIINPDRFPQGSEAPRERRRLRKKSRPPHLDSSILELDDRLGPEPTFHRPTTPDPRPCTPPYSNTGVSVNPPTTPSAAAQASSNPPAPMSPTSASKSPLLARIGSMRRWGRKRNSTATGHEELSVEHSEQHSGSSPTTRGGPQKILSMRAFDAEADRFDNNRTPRPHSRAVPTMPPSSTMLPHSTVDIRDVPQTPIRNRFFRGSPVGVDTGTSASARPSLTIDGQAMKRAQSREREQLRVAIPTAVPMTTQSSQSGESEMAVNISPRRARIRAFGQRLLPSKRSTSASSPERAKESSEGESSRTSSQGIGGHRQVSTPLSGETPTRLRPRIPGSHQGSSSLGKVRPIFPRHVSGSALDETRSRTSPAPSMGASGRSVSATDSAGTTASSDDLTHSEKESDEKGGNRGFMGSLRRISLASAHAQHQRQQRPSGSHSRPQSPVPAIPPVPALPLRSDSPSCRQTESSALGLTRPKSAVHTSISAAVDVDLASPMSSPPRDWLSSPPPRSGEAPVLSHYKSSSFATSSSPLQNTSLSRVGSTSQAASLGRASPLPIGTGASGILTSNAGMNVFRRSSLGDLKIPSRISRAQDGLKRDLGRVREFAARVEEMQELRASYFTIATQIQGILDTPPPRSRAASPTSGLFGISRSNSRARSNTNPPPSCVDYRSLALGFRAIDSKYCVAWECADLLIELGTGNVIEPTGQALGKTNSELPDGRSSSHGKNRERAVTLSGEEGKPDFALADVASPKSPSGGSPPAIVSWRASTGRHDLGHRQLYLLKEMLNNAEPAKEGVHLDIPEGLTNAEWATANEAMESSLTLPTDESVATNPPPGSTSKKKRTSRLVGIRDMLRSLKRNTARALQSQHEAIVMQSSTTLNTESSFDSQPRQIENHPYGYNTIAGIPSKSGNGRRKSETSAALVESMRSRGPDYSPFAGRLPLTHKSSPRRPSLASLFRLGQKHRPGAASSMDLAEQSNNALSNEVANTTRNTALVGKADFADTSREDDDTEDLDWDRMDSMSDVDVQMAAIADESATQGSTMKLRKKKQHNRLSMPPMARPITPKYDNLPFNSSQGSFATPDQSLTNVRSPRLSNVDENNVSMSSTGSAAADVHQAPATQDSSCRPHSRAGKDHDREKQFSSVCAVPAKSSKSIPSFNAPAAQLQPTPIFRLAMTPENIKPLLENARVVTSRLHDCLAEVKGLLLRTEGTVFKFSGSASSSHVAL